jgi:hypothetical protein
METFQFYLQSGKQRNVAGAKQGEWVGWGTTVMLFLVKISLMKKKCETVRCRDATASYFFAKVCIEVLAHFHAVAVKLHSSTQNWLFGLPGRILCEHSPPPFDVKENDEHAPDFALYLSCLVRSR